jgi:hypothetical protein
LTSIKVTSGNANRADSHPYRGEGGEKRPFGATLASVSRFPFPSIRVNERN